MNMFVKSKKIIALTIFLSLSASKAGAISLSGIGSSIKNSIAYTIKDFKTPTWKNSKGLILTLSLMAIYIAINLAADNTKIWDVGPFLSKYAKIASVLYAASPVAFNLRLIYKPTLFLTNAYLYPMVAYLGLKVSGWALNETLDWLDERAMQKARDQNIAKQEKEQKDREKKETQAREAEKKEFEKIEAKRKAEDKQYQINEKFYNACKKNDPKKMQELIDQDENNNIVFSDIPAKRLFENNEPKLEAMIILAEKLCLFDAIDINKIQYNDQIKQSQELNNLWKKSKINKDFCDACINNNPTKMQEIINQEGENNIVINARPLTKNPAYVLFNKNNTSSKIEAIIILAKKGALFDIIDINKIQSTQSPKREEDNTTKLKIKLNKNTKIELPIKQALEFANKNFKDQDSFLLANKSCIIE